VNLDQLLCSVSYRWKNCQCKN